MVESDFDPQSAIGRRFILPEFPDAVTIEGLDDWDDVLLLRVRTARGELKEAQIERSELARLAAEAPAPTAAYVDPDDLFMLAESVRIRHAYAWDPHFAVSMSGIEPLPHQLEAVYERMLPQSRLRFLLADDPGAGKTIMAGLLLKELRLRGAVERTLILAPAPLALQWQDELRSKFDEVFQLVDAHAVKQQLGGSPWKQFNQCVASMDFAKRDEIAPELLSERWDLVIIDEAHKVSTPNTDHPTQRYRLARELAERTEALLLLTATPHQGNPAQFQTLLGLLDADIFSSDEMVKRLLAEDHSPWILRRMKEDLRDFRGAKLFVKRHAYTEDFHLNTHEYALYEAVTEYINHYLPRRSGRRMRSAALARMVLQRRLASSLRAIRISLQNRHKRLRETLDALADMSSADRTRRLRELADLPVDPEVDTDDESEDELEDIAERAVIAERYEHLVDEVEALEPLVAQAIETENRGEESKLDALFRCLDHTEMKALEEENGKLIIFTEQRATLDYLREKLQDAGYTCCEIHGGMSAIARKAAQEDFRLKHQICIATDAAGEGINLQFCHLMINYDMPWNPMRLEQRMGRIHRFGQTRECHVFNFVATGGPLGPEAQPVVEGRVLHRLMEKLDEIR
ncbi:MAG: DEAD/DEAH box helicase, partial [Myxococcales bacterium]|nr:DEAD/DEAH box helicase [Myxococcales bacterium]